MVAQQRLPPVDQRRHRRIRTVQRPRRHDPQRLRGPQGGAAVTAAELGAAFQHRAETSYLHILAEGVLETVHKFSAGGTGPLHALDAALAGLTAPPPWQQLDTDTSWIAAEFKYGSVPQRIIFGAGGL